jgi:pimeloyl-ACP methyl ester carboxylesterase
MNAPVEFRTIPGKDGIRLNVALAGAGPLVLFVHGFPESWYSWRHQIGAVVAAGFRAAALEVRGYGASDKPRPVEAYSIVELAGDIAAVIDALAPEGAVLVGHDWGAVQVQAAALLHPAKVRGMVTVSVPAVAHPPRKPSETWPRLYGERVFYQAYFQAEGVAEAEFEPDLERFIRIFFRSLSGQGSLDDNVLIRPAGTTRLLDGLPDPGELPAWLSGEDLRFYAESFRRSGLRGPLNRYRCVDLDWSLMRPYADARIAQPSLFIGGTLEPTRYMVPGFDRYADPVPRLADVRGVHFLDGVGHWVQQEAPEETSRLILGFLATLDRPH